MPAPTYKDISQAGSPFEVPSLGRARRRELPVRPISAVRVEQGLPEVKAVRGYNRPIRSRRRLEGYGIQDPNEARAVPESVMPGTILERIVAKRNWYLYGPPGPTSWTSQYMESLPDNVVGGIRIDFIYWLTDPPLALEPQGLYWHDPFAGYGDATRAFIVQSYGYRYAELSEAEILGSTDTALDARIQSLVGGGVAPYDEQVLTHRREHVGLPRGTPVLKENRRLI